MFSAPAPVRVPDRTGEDLDHVVCCDDNRALCGIDVTTQPWRPDDTPPTCVVCADLDGQPCKPTCAYTTNPKGTP